MSLDTAQWWWTEVRQGTTYADIVLWGNEWLRHLWPSAYSSGFAPRGKGYDEYLLCTPPRIKIKQLPKGVQGQFDGATIWVCDYKTMRTLGTEHHRDELRATILHEAQHGFDNLRGLPLKPTHDAWFARRLRKLTEAFPPQGA